MPQKQNAPRESYLPGDLEQTLRGLPGLQVSKSRPGQPKEGVDAVLDIKVAGHRVRLIVECKGSIFPRDVVQLAAARSKATGSASSQVLLLAANSISPGGRASLREHHIGYWDKSGALYLELPWALYYIETPASRSAPRQSSRIFSGHQARVVHAMLHAPQRSWHVHELAREASVAASTVHQVLTRLEAELWVRRSGSGPETVRELVQPGQLLDAWADVHTLKRYEARGFFHLARSPAALESVTAGLLHQVDFPHALTLDAAAHWLAPHSTGVPRLSILIPQEMGDRLARLASVAGFKPAEEGANVAFLLTKEPASLMYRNLDTPLAVASPVQVYLDLHASPRRGREQAEHLRRTVLKF